MKSFKKYFIKTLCLILTLAFVVSFAACKPENGEDETTLPSENENSGDGDSPLTSLSLPYSKTDSLFPFAAESMINRQLMTLVYDSLFKINAGWEAEACIAESHSVSGLEISVKIKTDILFSDGSALSAADVAFSFDLAKESPAYSARLSNFVSAEAQGSSTVLFKLENEDPFAVNCLTFAVAKQGSEEKNSTGSGRYYIKEASGEHTLVVNPKHKNFMPKFLTLNLSNISDGDSLQYGIAIGNISFSFLELANGKYQRIDAATASTPMNNLVYLSFNTKNKELANEAFRKAASALIKRENIVTTAFQGHARAAETPFNPDWKELSKHKIESEENGKATEMLKAAGYDEKKLSEIVFTLAVNKDNGFKVATADFVAEQLASAGIQTEIVPLESTEFLTEVKKGAFDMYIGEVKLTANMSLAPLLSKGGEASVGIDTAGKSAAAYESFSRGETDLKDFIETFNEDMPLVPLCYRSGVSAYNMRLNVPEPGNEGDVYCAIDKWSY